MRAGIGFARIRNAGPLWDLAHHNNEAVRLVTEAEDRAEYLRTLKRKDEGGGDALVERLLHPERFQHAVSEFGVRKAAAVHPAAEVLAMALELAPRNYVAMIDAYAARAQGQWASMFECVHPATVFTETIGAPTNDGGACRWSTAVREEEWEWVGSGCELSLSA